VNPKSQQEQEQKKRRGPPRKYSVEFRQQALERLKSSANVTALARELGIRRKWLYAWRDQANGRVPEPRSSSQPKPSTEDRERRRMAELERLVARQALELDFFKGALQRIEERRRKREQTSATASTSKSSK
jgi:transposase-like protein